MAIQLLDKTGADMTAVLLPYMPITLIASPVAPTPSPTPTPIPVNPTPTPTTDFVLSAGTSLSSIAPKPGQRVVLKGNWPRVIFPWHGIAGNQIHVDFDAGAIVGDGQSGVVMDGGSFLDIGGAHVRNVATATLQAAGSAVKIYDGTSLHDGTIEDCMACAVAAFGTGGRMSRMTIQRAGQLCFTGQFVHDFIMDGCKLLYGNCGLLNPLWHANPNAVTANGLTYANPDWEAGFKLWSCTDAIIRNTESAFHHSPALWDDYLNNRITYENNYLHDCAGLPGKAYQAEGIRTELSGLPCVIRNNRIENNSGAGIAFCARQNVSGSGNKIIGPIGYLVDCSNDRGTPNKNIAFTATTYTGPQFKLVWKNGSGVDTSSAVSLA